MVSTQSLHSTLTLPVSMMSMDNTSQQSMADSFSHGWTLSKLQFMDFLGDSRCSFDTLDGASFIEMDPHFLSRRWTNGSATDDFDFDIPRSSSSSRRLVLPNHIFTDVGHLAPCPVSNPGEPAASASREDLSRSTLRTLLDRSGRRQQSGSCFESAPGRSASSEHSSPVFHSARSTPSATSSLRSHASISSAGKELKSTAPPINNFMKSPRKMLLKYLYFLIPLYKKIINGFRIKISPRSHIRSSRDSTRSSPRTSSTFSSIEWCRSNADISIADAILYCKRSNGQHSK